MWESRVAYRISVVKPDEERLLVRPKTIWEDNIKLNYSMEQGPS